MKKSKQAYYDTYFEIISNNIKNTWRGIKPLISLKTLISSVPTVLSLELKLLFGYPTAKFGLLLRTQPHSPDIVQFQPNGHQEPCNVVGSYPSQTPSGV